MTPIEKMNDTELVKLLAHLAANLVPIVGEPTAEEQHRRREEPAFIWYRTARAFQAMLIERDQKIATQRAELIEVRKELSALKKKK